MQKFLSCIKDQARKRPGRIVLPEAALDDRPLLAVREILKEKIAKPILVGRKIDILKRAKKLGITLDPKKVKIIDPLDSPLTEKYAREFFKLRSKKGVDEKTAWATVIKLNYFATMMVHMGDADGMVSGVTWKTAEKMLPALQIIKTKKKFHKVSGFFFMLLDKKILLFADCAITIDPNSHDLAALAIDTAETAKTFGIEPKVALLSFSTNRSADHPFVDKVREAVAIAQYERPDLIIEGEMQVDAALVPEICAKKFPNSRLKGDANVLIFERFKEEIRWGKPLTIALQEGFKRAWSSIFDGHVSTLISCVILMDFTTSLVKGFAITLSIGTLASLFSAVFVTRIILLQITKFSICQHSWLFGVRKKSIKEI